MERQEPYSEILQRLAKLEATTEHLQHAINCLTDKIDGYLEHRVKSIVKSMIGEIMIAVISSSAFVSFLLTFILRK